MFNLTAQDFKNGTIVGFASKVFLGGLKPNTIYICSTNDTAQLGSSTTNLLFGGTGSITNGVNISSPKTATSNENGEVEVLLRTTNIDNFLNNYWVQIEQGSTATSHVPHQEQNLPFTLGTQRMYQGSYLADDGIHYPTYTQTTLGNISSLQSGTIFGTACKYGGYVLPRSKGGGRNYNFKSNKVSPANEVYGKYKGYKNASNFVVMTDVNDTVENFNSKMSGLIVEYELAQEEIVPYNSTQQAQWNAIKEVMSYYKQTNIGSTSSELEAIIEANAVGDLNLILS